MATTGNSKKTDTLRSQVLSRTMGTVRLASLLETSQSCDIGKPITLGGFGRIHCFSGKAKKGWLLDPLPSIPASHKLQCAPEEAEYVQVLQVAACNLRCWYCFVDYSSLDPSTNTNRDFEVDSLVADALRQPDCPRILDLSGGNPGLVPEWILWTIRALKRHGNDRVYLWADDNLTVELYSQVLSANEISEISEFRLFGSVGCFKGFDDESFAFNTGLPQIEFESQFHNFEKILRFGWDLYAYATFTTPEPRSLAARIASFIDRLQEIDENLPLRLVPLEVKPYTPVLERLRPHHKRAIEIQYDAMRQWVEELSRRFDLETLKKPICDIIYASRRGS